MPIKDYKKSNHLHKNRTYKKISRYQNLNPKPYLVIMAFIFLGVLSYSWYQRHITDTTTPDQSKIRKISHLPAQKWKYIVIHHSAMKMGDVKRYDRFQQKKYKNGGLLYHFLIGNGNGLKNGKVAISSRWRNQLPGGHVHPSADQYNKWGIGICLVGNFEKHPPTKKQMKTLIHLTRWLMAKFNISPNNVVTHHEVNSTKCPGKLFPDSEFFFGVGRTGKSSPIALN